MPDTNSQLSPLGYTMLLPSLPNNIRCSCGMLQPSQVSAPSRNDIWLKPRPNTKWQGVENQRFVDLAQFDDVSVDGDEHESRAPDEADETSDEIPGREGSDSARQNEVGQGRNLTCDVSERPEVAKEVTLGSHSSSDSQLSSSICQQAAEQETLNEVLGPVEPKYDVVTQFLDVMEDQDLHRDSISRIRSFFKMATPQCLEQCSVAWKGSRILLEDRNLSDKTFRAYPRSLTPKQLYNALGRQVGKRHYPDFSLD